MKKNKLILILVAALISGSIIAYKMIPGFPGNKAVLSSNMSNNELGIPVETAHVQLGEVAKEINYVGTIVSESPVVVSPKVTSQVDMLELKEGDYVMKGDVVAVLDDSQLSATLDSTLKKMETLKVNISYLDSEIKGYYTTNATIKKIETLELNCSYLNEETEKYRMLYEEGAISKSAYGKIKHEKDMAEMQLKELRAASENAYSSLTHEREVAQMQLKELEAVLNELNINLEETKIVAPISGRIRTFYYKAGDLAVAGKPFAIIDDTENLIAKVNVTEQDLKKINVGTKVALNITGVEDEVKTSVSRIMPSINEKTRVGEVEIEITAWENGASVAIGTSTEVRLIIDEVKETVVVPKAAIKKLNNKEFVYIIEGGNTVREQEIKTGLVAGERIQVVEGLETGNKIAVNNLTRLFDGVKVYVIEGEDK
jgi:HlyD family secretion protein